MIGCLSFILLCDWLFRIARFQTQTVRLQAQNSAIKAELLFLGTNQNHISNVLPNRSISIEGLGQLEKHQRLGVVAQ